MKTTRQDAAPPNWTFPDLSARIAAVSEGDLDWKRLGVYVVRRREELGLTQPAVHAAGGPSTATLRFIEKGTNSSYRNSNLRALERVLRWPAGAIDRILAGGEPNESANQAVPQQGISAQEMRRLEAIASNPNRSEPLRAWARALLGQINELHEAEQQEARERGA